MSDNGDLRAKATAAKVRRDAAEVLPITGVFLERQDEFRKRVNVSARDFVTEAGMNYSVISSLRTRKVNSPALSSIYAVAETWMLSYSWLLTKKDTDMWHPALIHARRELREWAKSTPATWTPTERLVKVWEKLHELLPAFKESVWASYLGWATHLWNYDEYKGVTMEDWLRCKAGHLQPGEIQLNNAAWLTGLPESWLWEGDGRLLQLDTDREQELHEWMAAHRMDVNDVIAAVKHYEEHKRKNPRS